MPIVMTKEEWSRITKCADTNRQDPEVTRRREYVKYLDETSKNMTKNWPNSLENVNKRNEELRRARIEAAEQANNRFYQRYLKRKREEQRELMYRARETVFQNKDAPKLLLSAVIETAVQKERQEQLKFNEMLRGLAAEQKKKDDDDIIRKAKEWHQLMATRRKRRFEVNKQHQKEILEQAHEVSERNRIEYETELEMQKVDNIRASEQMEELKKFEEEFKAAEKSRILSDMQRSRQETEQRRREAAARDTMDDRLIDVLQRSRVRVENRRKQTENDVKAEKLRVLEQISAKLESGDAAREAKDNENLQKAIREKEEAAEARRVADEKKRAQFREERVKTRQQFLRDEEKRLHEFNTMRQWEIMNRFKNAELYEDFKEKLRLDKEKKIKEYREDILKLWKEREDREAKERADTRYFYGELAERKLREADNKLLTLGNKLLEEARENGRPEYALRRAIDRYCKQYRLYPMPKLYRSMQEHFGQYGPVDLSQPDPDYKYPEPPLPEDQQPGDKQPGDKQPGDIQPGDKQPGDKQQDKQVKDKGVVKQTEEKLSKRDGLQPIEPVVGSSKQEKKESQADYKTRGPANGLQRKVASLPKIPCQTESCSCELKK